MTTSAKSLHRNNTEWEIADLPSIRFYYPTAKITSVTIAAGSTFFVGRHLQSSVFTFHPMNPG
jgi:hypothetical protein